MRQGVTRRSVYLCAGLIFAASACSSSTPARPAHHNPVFSRDFPDPMVLRVSQHDYYAYATATEWQRGYFPILHSSDLIHWHYVGDVFPLTRRPGLAGDLWAPDVIRRRQTYYVYFVTTNTVGIHCIDVATGPSPTGPFRERGFLACTVPFGAGLIDPAPLITPTAAVYLYVSVDTPHKLAVIRLKPDLLHEATRGRPVLGMSQVWEGRVTVEGPFPLLYRGRYFLFYSGNSFDGPDYAVGYGVGTAPTGPFRKCACNPILHREQGIAGPGGESVVRGPDNRLWIVYHAWSHGVGYEHGGARTLWVDHLQWNGRQFSVSPTL
jgi:arabinan endo-1,5-alpha-L-arabinosidase